MISCGSILTFGTCGLGLLQPNKAAISSRQKNFDFMRFDLGSIKSNKKI
jgi:hypothetical protein